MRTEAIEIDRFYRTPRGVAARTMVHRRLQALWPETNGLDVLGYGFAGPYLEPFRETARRAVAFMPSTQGAVAWPDRHGERCASTLGEETRLPFAEGLFDRIIAIHALEEADDLQRLLRELWRVLAPEGRLVIVAPHRSGAWARVDTIPFGHGRPFSRVQLTRLLTGALFEPVAWARALYAPPWNLFCGPQASAILEKAGERAWPAFGGLILVEAIKHVGAVRPRAAAVPVRRKTLDAVPGAALSPLPTRQTATEKDKRS